MVILVIRLERCAAGIAHRRSCCCWGLLNSWRTFLAHLTRSTVVMQELFSLVWPVFFQPAFVHRFLHGFLPVRVGRCI